MGILSGLRKIENKFSWSFLGVLVGVISIGYAVYVDRFREEKPVIVFDILSNTQVLSLRENVNKLDIIYNGQNLKERQENLILLTVRISNEGDRDVSEHDYYSKIPFGLIVSGGKIAEKPILIDASSTFLKDNVSINFDTLNGVILNDIPIDRGQYFSIKILTICKENSIPSITSTGKISGISGDFVLRQSFKEGQKEESSFIRVLTYGSFGIHVVRFLFYFVCLFGIAFLILAPFSLIWSGVDKKNRSKIIREFRNQTKFELSKDLVVIIEIYRLYGAEDIYWLRNVVGSEERLNAAMESFSSKESHLRFITSNALSYDETRSRYSILRLLLDDKIIFKDGDEFKVDNAFVRALDGFSDFVEFR